MKKAVNFIPLPGELILYDGIIENGQYKVLPRFKIGDGITKINDLPFMNLKEEKEKPLMIMVFLKFKGALYGRQIN